MLPFLWYLLALVKLQIETVCFIVHRNWTLSNPNDLSLYQACATLGSMCRDLEKQIHAVLVPRSIIPGWLCTQLITTKGITNSWCGQSAQSWSETPSDLNSYYIGETARARVTIPNARLLLTDPAEWSAYVMDENALTTFVVCHSDHRTVQPLVTVCKNVCRTQLRLTHKLLCRVLTQHRSIELLLGAWVAPFNITDVHI